MNTVKLRVIGGEFSVCKITSLSEADFSGEYIFLSKTDDELSLVCETRLMPPAALKREEGFAMLKITGPLDFTLVGIISGITGILSKNGISVFVVSTYDTDYILIKREYLENAVKLLAESGYAIE